GAPLPEGTDTVLIKEQAEVVDGRVRALADPGPGRHVRRRGEDVEEGALLATAGQRLTPARLALLAAQGIEAVEVVRPPTVAVFCTGDELVEPGMPLGPGQIYNSNRELLMGLLRAEGLEPVAWPTLPDDPAVVESALRHAGEAFDLLRVGGGEGAAAGAAAPARPRAFLEGGEAPGHAGAAGRRRHPRPGAVPVPAGQPGIGAGHFRGAGAAAARRTAGAGAARGVAGAPV